MAKFKRAKRNEYKSDIVLGERYRDEQTGFEGIATAMHFYQHACERITLENYDKVQAKLQEFTFDAPRLIHIETQVQAKSKKTGGPERAGERREVAGR